MPNPFEDLKSEKQKMLEMVHRVLTQLKEGLFDGNPFFRRTIQIGRHGRLGYTIESSYMEESHSSWSNGKFCYKIEGERVLKTDRLITVVLVLGSSDRPQSFDCEASNKKTGETNRQSCSLDETSLIATLRALFQKTFR